MEITRGEYRAGRPSPRLVAACCTLAFAVSGCAAWQVRARPVREGEQVEFATVAVRTPAGGPWRAARRLDVPWETLKLTSEDGRMLEVAEYDRVVTRDELRATVLPAFRARAASMLRDPAAAVEELPLEAPPNLGTTAAVLALRAVESDASAGLLEKEAVHWIYVLVTPPGSPGHTSIIVHMELGRPDPGVARVTDAWRSLLAGVALRPADDASLRAAAASNRFPKTFQPGLARRSLTLPAGGIQWGLSRAREVAPGRFHGSAGVSMGLADRLELDLPGFFRFSLGEPEALSRPEFAIGAGLVGWEHDAVRGSVWTLGASVEARQRLSRSWAVRGGIFVAVDHASRTGTTGPRGTASVGIVGDVVLVSAGLEVGGRWVDRADEDRASPWRTRQLWIGGLDTPVLSLHVPLLALDLGLLAAGTWDGSQAGAVVGGTVLVTF